jgi:glutathione peroxidase
MRERSIGWLGAGRPGAGVLGAVGILASMLLFLVAASAESPQKETLFDLEAARLSGNVESLGDYRGEVLLVVNTASECGYTPQYEGLESLYEKYRGQGFSVLGFPSNDFGGQEPGTDPEIGAFCKRNYGVEFPMFSKVKVNGKDQHPVYAFLTSRPQPVGGPVRWNFEKYLVDRSGQVVSRFPSNTKPMSSQMVAAIEELLGSDPVADPGDAAGKE